MYNRPTTLLLFCLFLIGTSPVSAQDAKNVEPAPEARPSPMRLAATTIDGTYIKVVYGSPRMRDREIFGGLVPWGEVWRTGANEATEILFTEDVIFGGQRVEQGIYTLFSIPSEDSWTIILNSVLGQWGAFTHDPEKDVYRVDVPSSESDTVYEAFTMSFDEGRSKTALRLNWDDTQVVIPIEPAE
jgi:hypothetical protein